MMQKIKNPSLTKEFKISGLPKAGVEEKSFNSCSLYTFII